MRSVEVKQDGHEQGEIMKTRITMMIGIAGMGLMMALPAQAAPDYVDSAYMIAQRNIDDGARRSRQDEGRDERKSYRRDAERDDQEGFGYGYERRKRESGSQEPVQQDRRGSRGNNGGRR
jgi:hypothetical protein